MIRNAASPESKEKPSLDVAKTGMLINRLLDKKDMSVKELAKYLDLAAPQSVYRWFYGKSAPTIDQFIAMSELFGCSIDDMIVRKGQKMEVQSGTIKDDAAQGGG